LPSTSKVGYNFDGWYSAATGGTFLGYAGANYTVTQNVTLYARFSQITYTVSWNANGGSVSPTSTDGAWGQVITAPTPTRSGYTFSYWRNPSAGDLLYSVNAGQSWTINGTLTFTAVWTVAQYTVYFNANGGSVTPPSSTVNSGSSVTLPTPSRSGYTFNGWYTAISGGTYLGSGGNLYTPSNSIEIYAQWSNIQYTVTWSPNGGTVSPSSNIVNAGGTVTAPTPTRSGYTFSYWRHPSAGDLLYLLYAGNNFTPESSVTFTAIWSQDIVQYTVTYNANGGTVSPTTSTVNSGSSVTLPTPSRSGYTFDGWYTATTGGSYIGGAGSTYIPTASIIIYARWTVVQTQYTVTWNNNDGTGNYSQSTGTSGTVVTAPTPTRSGYTFSYWRNPASGGDPIFVNGGASYTITGNISFWAIWTQAAQNKTAPSVTGVTKSGSNFLVSFSGGSGPAYQVWWQTNNSTPSNCGPGDAQGTSSPITVTNLTSPSANTTYYFFVRSTSSTATTDCGPSVTASDWGGPASYTSAASTPPFFPPHFPPFFPPFFPPHFPPFFPPHFPPFFPPFFPPHFPPFFPPFFPPHFPPFFPPFFPPYFPGGGGGGGGGNLIT
jgi:uncharacterized repeat protein (TIGR02543 family)